ncbi:hypothetical protein B7R54_14750 [Subtercola boreus]|uniref:WxL domain-containing protein n=1 Tax=Subtercola boreus TaxID=120213 RepID=A0A3E0VLI1_9MICO|nr:hypothetical protein [Subtercola boreus]RFA10328.1 hypothetical protein B7R54_14750 [Subtercola boreus]TQL56165.1 hypothetical protein FB464_3752 [Subtercola boreus]
MLRKNALRIAAIGVAAASLVGTSAFSAAAATSNGSDAIYYLYDSGTEALIAPGHVNLWDDDLVGSPSATDARSLFSCPDDAESVQTFISPVGQEKVRSAWVTYADGGFKPGTKQILEPGANLGAQVLGSPGAGSVKAAGGNYSVGFACEKFNNVAFASAGIWFAPISVTAGSGDWTYQLSDTVAPPAPASGSFDQTIQATTIAGVDGTLNLVAPASATTTLGAATLVGGQSTSTGDLGKFTVQDGRVVTHKGWTVTTQVTDFANASDATVTIPASQLTVTPKVATGATLPTGVTLSAPFAGGSTLTAFAAAGNTAAIASTDLDAGLKFVAPGDKPAGTYTAKMTITLASK